MLNKNMLKTYAVESAEDYPAPREHPLEYPGYRPAHSNVLVRGKIHPIIYNTEEYSHNSTSSGIVVDEPGNVQNIDTFLEDLGVAPMNERYPILAYGSNAVPGQLISKFGESSVVPVIYGYADDMDIIYNLISDQGYAYAELLLNQKGVSGSVAVTFLDCEQLEKMNASEPNYRLAFMPFNLRLESGDVLKGGENGPGLFYAGFRNIWVPDSYDSPIAIAELSSKKRRLPKMTQREVLDLVIDEFNLPDIEIYSAKDLSDYIKRQSNMKDADGKLKYLLQERIRNSPKSLKPLVDQVVIVPDSANPPKVFGDN